MNSRSDLADLAKLLGQCECEFVNEKPARLKHGNVSFFELVSTAQRAMVQLAEFTKNFQTQGLRMQEMMARLEQAVALLKAIHKGQISDVNKEIETFLNLKSNIVNFALEGQIAPETKQE